MATGLPRQSWRLPPLNALKAFAAAGRHQSFSTAAKELFVTVGAISRQIKLLEDYVGVSLFTRASHDISLTPQGRSYHATVCALLDRIDADSSRLVGSARGRPLHIMCPMTFGLNWLFPKLRSFHRQHPEQQLRITTTLSPLYNLPNHNDVDVSFQLAKGPTPGWVCHPLVCSQLAIVCSPALIAPRTGVGSIDELLTYPVLRSKLQAMVGPDGWDLFVADVAPAALAQVQYREYPSLELAIAAAIAGKGIAMAPAAFIKHEVDAGRLLCPLGKFVSTGHYYYMIHSAEASRHKRIENFRHWLLGQPDVAEVADQSDRGGR